MNTKFKRHQSVKLLVNPDPEYVEFHRELENDENDENEKVEETPIVKGMTGKINIILPNGQYHVEILNKKGETIAYAKLNEEDLESI